MCYKWSCDLWDAVSIYIGLLEISLINHLIYKFNQVVSHVWHGRPSLSADSAWW